MASILKVDTIQDQSGNNIINENADTITIGASGDTITIPSGATIDLSNATQTGVGGVNTPAFKAGRSSAQTSADGASTTIIFDTEEFDTASAYDVATGTFTVPTGQDGKYFLYAIYRWQETATYNSNLEIRKNGNQIAHFGGGNNSSYNSNSLAILTTLSAGDAITIRAFQDSGVTRTLTGNVNYTYFLGYKIIE